MIRRNRFRKYFFILFPVPKNSFDESDLMTKPFSKKYFNC
uniref:Uncharacterized protein n=1 Tax=Leptospira santarosai serovar Arenal str. MAVJ 401 TaxID=1049976 RepID=M6JVS7_9LEPT|nr:hypothetical protein LEP1GSC063_1659 [Leptospira santarosai serovar Arenal str. MAVJ 401]